MPLLHKHEGGKKALILGSYNQLHKELLIVQLFH